MSDTGDPATGGEAFDLSDPALLAGVFEASLTPMVLVAADAPRFTIVMTNKAHAATLRRPQEDMRGAGRRSPRRADRASARG